MKRKITLEDFGFQPMKRVKGRHYTRMTDLPADVSIFLRFFNKIGAAHLDSKLL